MSEKIKIDIVASGAAAAAEIQKVEQAIGSTGQAAKDVDKGAGSGLSGMFDGVPERAEEVAESIKEIGDAALPMSEHLGEAVDEVEELGEAADDAGPKLDKLINIQRAQVAAEIGKGLARAGDKVREASERFADADPEFSKTLGNLATGLDTASSAAVGAAQGFAIGGPLGAAIGGLIGAAIVPLNAALNDMIESMARAAESEKLASEMAKKHAEMLAMGADAYIAASEAAATYRESLGEMTESIDEQVAALERRNRVLDSGDKTDEKTQDFQDEEKIRAGSDPEDVRIERAAIDREKKLSKIDRKLEPKAAEAQGLFDVSRAAKVEAQRVESDPSSTDEDKKKAKEAAAAAESRSRKSLADFNASKEVAIQERQGVRVEYESEVASARFDKKQRLEREFAEAEKKAKLAQFKRQQAARQANLRNLEGSLESREEELDEASRETGLKLWAGGQRIGKRGGKASKEAGTMIESIGKRLADGTNSKELQRIGDEVAAAQARLGAQNVAAIRKLLSELNKLSGEMENVKGQIKTLRTGK
jgi:ABC-type transporter Mla subunit MlaD